MRADLGLQAPLSNDPEVEIVLVPNIGRALAAKKLRARLYLPLNVKKSYEPEHRYVSLAKAKEPKSSLRASEMRPSGGSESVSCVP